MKYGIVLDYHQAGNCWSILTPHAGLQQARLYGSGWARGQLIHYEPALAGPWTKSARSKTDSQILQIPTCWAHADIHFLHHVWEILLFFVPPYQEAHEVFTWCLQLYCNDQIKLMDAPRARILFLLYLMYSIGVYPDTRDETVIKSWRTIQQAHSPRHDTLYDLCTRMPCIDYSRIIGWLYQCIQEHPRVRAFKTISYLKVVDYEDNWCASHSCW